MGGKRAQEPSRRGPSGRRDLLEKDDAVWEDLITGYRLLRRELERVLQRHGMLLSEFQALKVLVAGPTPMGQVAERLGLSPATLTTLARGLLKRGWARSALDPHDRRAMLLRATPRGVRAFREARGDYRVRVRALGAGFPLSEKRALARGLRSLRATLEHPSLVSPRTFREK